MPYEPVVPDGLHLGTSRTHDGAVVGHLFDDNNELRGHATWEWVDEPEPEYEPGNDNRPPRHLTPEEVEAIAELAGLLVLGILKTVEVTAPVVGKWWNETAAPAMESAWKALATMRRKLIKARTPRAAEQIVFIASPSGIEIEKIAPKVSMSRAEWEARFRAMLAAGEFKERQQRILANARIEESADYQEQLTPQQFADAIQATLAANPALLDEATTAELMRILRVTPEKPDTEPGQLGR
ncbi:hypothetical protein [Leifsonia shinshuensis]